MAPVLGSIFTKFTVPSAGLGWRGLRAFLGAFSFSPYRVAVTFPSEAPRRSTAFSRTEIRASIPCAMCGSLCFHRLGAQLDFPGEVQCRISGEKNFLGRGGEL